MPDRPLCLLLPGFDGTGRLFAPLLAEDRLPFEPRVVALPFDAPRGYDEFATWLADQLPTDRQFALLAESFSGPLAIRIASRRPKLLTHLVLVATFLCSPLRPSLSVLARLAHLGLFTRPPPAFAVRTLLTGWDAAPSIVAAVRDAMAVLPPEVSEARARAALSADEAGAFAGLTIPTLWIRASADRLLRPGCADDASSSRPGIRLLAIDGPHMLLQVRPGECLSAIERFLAVQTSMRERHGAI